jgi:hypothetical protein
MLLVSRRNGMGLAFDGDNNQNIVFIPKVSDPLPSTDLYPSCLTIQDVLVLLYLGENDHFSIL